MMRLADPGAIQLFAFPTANRLKVSIVLEETGLKHEAHKIPLSGAMSKALNSCPCAPTTRPRDHRPKRPGRGPFAIDRTHPNLETLRFQYIMASQPQAECVKYTLNLKKPFEYHHGDV